MIPTTWAIGLAFLLALLGMLGLLSQRSALRTLVSVELILNAANINFVAFAQLRGDATGLTFTLFSIALAAAEAAVGLGILLHVYRHMKTVDVTAATGLRW